MCVLVQISEVFNCFQHQRALFMSASCEFPNDRSSVDEALIACAGFHMQQLHLKQTEAAKGRFSILCLSISLLVPSVKLAVLACLLHICCASILKARDGTGKINRCYDGRRAAMNIRLFLLLCNQIYGG